LFIAAIIEIDCRDRAILQREADARAVPGAISRYCGRQICPGRRISRIGISARRIGSQRRLGRLALAGFPPPQHPTPAPFVAQRR